MFAPERFVTSSLQSHPRRASIARILASAFQSVHAGEAVKKFLQANPLPRAKRVYAFGLGKAACDMASALADSTPLADCLIITKHASPLHFAPASVIEGNHPIPGEASLAAGRAAREFVSRLTPDDLLVCLISGGGSSLMAAPIIPLNELQSLTSALLASGAPIEEINTLRRHLDLLKGGGLAQAAHGARIVSLILSDVVGDSIEAIASGPTAPDPSTREEAITIVRRTLPEEANPLSKVRRTLPFRETLKPNDPIFRNIHNHIIASNDIALRAAKEQAEAEGLRAQIIESGLKGEARQVGKRLAEKLLEATRHTARPFCLLEGGETTVTLTGNGRGGRNQELALGAVETLRGVRDVMALSIATDGEDGPTDAAGAVATGESASRAESLGMAASDHLSRNDAYVYFEKLGDLLKPGPSGTNVNDLVFLFAF